MSILDNEIPEVVYHYCSLETMMKIFQTKYLIGSIHTSMNDFIDSSWWLHLLTDRAKIVATTDNEKNLNDFLNLMYINELPRSKLRGIKTELRRSLTRLRSKELRRGSPCLSSL